MMETKNTPYAVAEFLGTPGEMAAWLEACIHESEGDAAFIAKELGDLTCEKECRRSHANQDYRVTVCTKHSLLTRTQGLTQP